MENYELQEDEIVLFKGYAYITKIKTQAEIILTNQRIVLTTTKHYYPKEEVDVETYQISDIEILDNVPQIKINKERVEIHFNSDELILRFSSKTESQKFTNVIKKLFSDKPTINKAIEKIKNFFNYICTALGITPLELFEIILSETKVGRTAKVATKVAATASPKKGKANTSDDSKEKNNHTGLKTAANIGLKTAELIVHNLNTAQKQDAPESKAAKTSTTSTEKASTNINDNIEAVKKLKELLDAEILTQAEFDTKKKQLLGL